MNYNKLISTLDCLVFEAQENCSSKERADDLAEFENEILELIREKQEREKPVEQSEGYSFEVEV